MPTSTPAPALPECVTVIIQAECGTHPFTAAADHTFRCPCGSWITARDIDLDGATVWAVTRTGHLAYLPDPADAGERYVQVRTVVDDPGQWEPGLDDAHRAFREALAELEAAQLLAAQLPDGADVQIGRVYLACVLNADGTLSGSNASAVGWPCEACSPRAADPYYQQRYPWRNPRGHAWTQVRDWERNVNNDTLRMVLILTATGPAASVLLALTDRWLRPTGLPVDGVTQDLDTHGNLTLRLDQTPAEQFLTWYRTQP